MQQASPPLPLFLSSSSSDDENPVDEVEENQENERKTNQNERRKICLDGCGRPSSVCICPYLPPNPLPTSTRLLILHHPHELRHHKNLSTLPPLLRCLLNSHPLPGRRLRLGSHPLLDSLSSSSSTKESALFLFPSFPPSPSPTDLVQWAADTPAEDRTDPVLIVFDGTWRQAREMAAASLPFLSRFARHVTLGACDVGVEGPSTFESDLVLRKEPFAGCMSSMEAVARAMRILEPDGVGKGIEEALLRVLRAMVGFQARYLKPVKPRTKMRKKKEMEKDRRKQMEEEVDQVGGYYNARDNMKFGLPMKDC